MAAVVTMAGRSAEWTLASLRPQVDRLAVYCNRMVEPPQIVRDLADVWICDPSNSRGSGAKLHWADEWDGLYLACDDDLAYPVEYARVMASWVEHWGRKALVTCHGRVLKSDARRFKDATFTAHALRDTPEGQWLNYPGGCALAFDTSLDVPADLPGQSVEEAGLAVWAQAHGVPIWLVPHTAQWLTYLLPLSHAHTIWNEEVATNFARRNAVLAPQGAKGWTVHQPVAVAA